jgi:hypothetical protein
MTKIKLIIFLFVTFLTVGCNIKTTTASKEDNEIVLTDRMSVIAQNINGKLTISAGKKYYRTFTWAGGTRSVFLHPREKRWNGSLGLYFSGSGSHWKKHDNVTRAVIEEGILHFNSKNEVLTYIGRYEDQCSLAYSDNGLFVYWDKSLGAGGTLNVLIWQFLINGSKPEKLPGSDNNKIQLLRK